MDFLLNFMGFFIASISYLTVVHNFEKTLSFGCLF